MRTKRFFNLLFLLAAMPIAGLHAQPSPVLEAYIRDGLANNLALRQQNLDLQRSLEAVRQARSLFYPTVQFNATYTRSTGGRSIEIPVGDMLNPVYSTLNQLLQTNAFPMLENQREQFLPDNFHETYLKVAYPLFNSDLKYNRQIQEQMVLGKTATKAALEHELRYRITEAYLRYLQTIEAQKIWVNTKEVLMELRRFNESLVKNNVATRDVVATADYELSKAENEIFQLSSQQNTARAYFNFLTNRDLQADVVVDTTLLNQGIPVYNLADLVRDALANRQELAALQAGQAAAETALKMNEANRILPDLYIGGQVGFQGFGYKFDGDQAYALAQVGLTYDLFSGGQKNSKTQQARIETEKLRAYHGEVQQQIALQVTQAANNLESARNAWASARQGLVAAEEIFRIVNNKYRANQALLLEYQDAQNRATTARLQVVLAWVEVLVREAEVRKAAGI
ncbi:MAG: TolC family protein [Lewinellaceae bacterium]|nr:TolC family protein [Lewinellaceae bacterium]